MQFSSYLTKFYWWPLMFAISLVDYPPEKWFAVWNEKSCYSPSDLRIRRLGIKLLKNHIIIEIFLVAQQSAFPSCANNTFPKSIHCVLQIVHTVHCIVYRVKVKKRSLERMASKTCCTPPSHIVIHHFGLRLAICGRFVRCPSSGFGG